MYFAVNFTQVYRDKQLEGLIAAHFLLVYMLINLFYGRIAAHFSRRFTPYLL